MSIETAKTKLLDELGSDREAEFSGADLANLTRISAGTLYVALWQLENGRLIASRWEFPEPLQDRPRRRLYRITDEGRKRRAIENTRPRRPGLIDRLFGLFGGVASER